MGMHTMNQKKSMMHKMNQKKSGNLQFVERQKPEAGRCLSTLGTPVSVMSGDTVATVFPWVPTGLEIQCSWRVWNPFWLSGATRMFSLEYFILLPCDTNVISSISDFQILRMWVSQFVPDIFEACLSLSPIYLKLVSVCPRYIWSLSPTTRPEPRTRTGLAEINVKFGCNRFVKKVRYEWETLLNAEQTHKSKICTISQIMCVTL
jgi:hypothetical protein